jgi:hypothetical protein
MTGACKKDKAKDIPTDHKAAVTPKDQDTETPTKTPIVTEPSTNAWTGDDTAKTLQNCWAAFNGKDEATYVGCYADDGDFSYVDFAPATTMTGAEAIGGARLSENKLLARG